VESASPLKYLRFYFAQFRIKSSSELSHLLEYKIRLTKNIYFSTQRQNMIYSLFLICFHSYFHVSYSRCLDIWNICHIRFYQILYYVENDVYIGRTVKMSKVKGNLWHSAWHFAILSSMPSSLMDFIWGHFRFVWVTHCSYHCKRILLTYWS